MKILLVDDEPQILRGVSRIIGCEQDEWEVDTADSGKDALDLLQAESDFDVVISDMQMPGMNGAQLLGEIGKLYPNILRIVLSGQADRDSVLSAIKPMHQYLSKPCEGSKLIEVISRAYIFQETIRSAEVLDAIGRANGIPTFPDIINRINSELESETSTSKSVSRIVAEDPILSARVFQLANSSIFSMRNVVSSIEKAVSVIGVDMIKSLAMSQVVVDENKKTENVLSTKSLFDHSFQVAVVAKSLASQSSLSLDDGNQIFSAGLLHDVGKILLLNSFPEKYKTAMDTAKSRSIELADAEMEMFDATHQGVGGYMLSLWGLPANVIEAVASHHSFAECAKIEGSVASYVFAANWIVNDRSEDDLNKRVEASDASDNARRFADQINAWQESIKKGTED